MEFSIEKGAMLMVKSGKRLMTEWMELSNQEKIRTLGEKKTYKYLGMLEADTVKQGEMKEKIFKSVSQENEKATWNQTILQKPNNKRDKYLSCSPRKILGTILEVDMERT